MEPSKVDVSLIYRYKEADGDSPWRWAAGKSGLSDVAALNGSAGEPGALYR